MTLSIVIPTYNRPKELRNCLESILHQTVPPVEILVMDDGDLPEMPLVEQLEARGVTCQLHRKTEKGLTRSRNQGIDHATGDIVQFFDDDVVLEPAFLQAQLDVYEAHPEAAFGGLSGLELNLCEGGGWRYLEYFYNRLFLLSPPSAGGITPTGFAEQLAVYRAFPPRRLTAARMLGGSSFSFRRHVFDDFRFAEHYTHGYCQGEDKDFSLRASSKYQLHINPDARYRHYHSPLGRVDKYRRGRDYLLSAHDVYVRFAHGQRAGNALFYYSFAGYWIRALAAAMLKPGTREVDRLRGLRDALREIRSTTMS